MIAILLAAGYATRLYPLTKDQAKPLLPLAGRPILEHILDDLQKLEPISQIILVCNHRFIHLFEKWSNSYKSEKPLVLLDDGSTENDNRLGAVRDIELALDKQAVDDDILVLAGDNIFDFSLAGFLSFFEKQQLDSIMIHLEQEIEKLRKTGVAEIADGKVVSFEEKPAHPKGCHAVPPFYIYRRQTLPLIRKYLQHNLAADAPGSLIAWLCQQIKIAAYPMPGKRFDIGDLASYEAAQRLFK